MSGKGTDGIHRNLDITRFAALPYCTKDSVISYQLVTGDDAGIMNAYKAALKSKVYVKSLHSQSNFCEVGGE